MSSFSKVLLIIFVSIFVAATSQSAHLLFFIGTLVIGAGFLFGFSVLSNLQRLNILLTMISVFVFLLIGDFLSQVFLRHSTTEDMMHISPFLIYGISLLGGISVTNGDPLRVGMYLFKKFPLMRNFLFDRLLVQAKILDTSAVLDDRIFKLVESEYLEGMIIVPFFVVKELQLIADSKDHIKRSRGRLALENFENAKNKSLLYVVEKDYPNLEEVDDKLIAMGKFYKGTVVTSDYNLQQVLTIHNVKSFNINFLASVLKPNLQVDDVIEIQITKIGKERRQGIGYLEDGTMVVVEDSSHLIGKNCTIQIVSCFQNDSNRIFFAEIYKQLA